MYDDGHIESDRRDNTFLLRARRRAARRLRKDIEHFLDKWIPFNKLTGGNVERARLIKIIQKLFRPHLDNVVEICEFVPVWPKDDERNDY